MKNLFTRIRCNFEKRIFRFRESNYDFLRLHLGTNSVFLGLALFICIIISFRSDVLRFNYLKGLNHDLAFFIGLFSIIFGVGFCKFWRLGEKSIYTIHFVKTKFMPRVANVIFVYKDFSFGISSRIKTQSSELSATLRKVFCIGIFFNLALITLDNGGFDKLARFPSEILQSKTGYCPTEEEEEADNAPPIDGCELIVRAYKLGYAKDLGICEPETIDPSKMKVCEKRREDEPYFHHMSRLFVSSVKKKLEFFNENRAQQIADKFALQLEKLDVLKDYRSYAMSASPRASHHIWTNLPYPVNSFVQKYREVFRPNYCIKQFQNQTNTVWLEDDDERKNSKLLEHVYGQLLFNPKSPITVGFCKEYAIHWNAESDICERLAANPEAVLSEQKVLADVELVLRRHDIANVISSLDEEIRAIQKTEGSDVAAKKEASEDTEQLNSEATDRNPGKGSTNKIVTSKIAKGKQQIRKKNELVSFQCFMQTSESASRTIESSVKLKDTDFLVRTRYFPLIEDKGDSQISMYREFSKVLENRFHYSQLTSRSDISFSSESGIVSADEKLLEEPSYLFSKLQMLENVDIFLGNNWVLEREDLLEVYPYHVHLQNYVSSFRTEYQKSRGRL